MEKKHVFAASVAGTILLLAMLATTAVAGGHKPCKPTPKNPCPLEEEEPTHPMITTDPETGAAHFSDVDHHRWDGRSSGNRPPRQRNLQEIGSLDFTDVGLDDANTDVWALGNYAYVGTFDEGTVSGALCPGTGVKVVDISDPTSPTFVGNISSPTSDILIPFVPGLQSGEIHTRANDVKVRTINTRSFGGDLLVHTNEPCDGLGDGGIVLYDVTDPTDPQRLGAIYDLADLIGGSPTGEAFGVHNTYIFERGKKAYVMVVANINPDDYDFRIVDVSDPSSPKQVGRWSSTVSPDAPPVETRGTSRSLGLHDVWAGDNGKIGYLSYWDAGYILLDVSNPANPTFIGNSTWVTGDEGNAHAAVPAQGGNLLITSDEDFSATGLGSATLNNASTPFGTVFEAIEAVFTVPLADFSGSFTGDLAWVGLGDTEQNSADDPSFGCASGQPYAESVAGKIALIKRGFCRFDEKIFRAESEGAVAAIVFNDAREDLILMGGNPIVAIPGVFIRGSRGEALADLREAGTSVNVTLTEGVFNGFGFGRIFDIQDASAPRLLSTIKLVSTLDPALTNPFGSHNVVVRGETAYFSWYQDGVVVVDFSDPTAPRVIAEFNDNNNHWGIYVQGELILASDRATGLHIYKHVP
ncbi:MAG: hypothetical protein IIA89_12665 [Chloroflexi bacterium]|nr:hypothetical protein [Chloroflexota bacterium]